MSRWTRWLLCWLVLAAVAVQAQPEQSPEDSDTAAEQAPAESGTGNDDADKKPAADTGDSSTSNDDFKPTEQISEDFPVSLPADI